MLRCPRTYCGGQLWPALPPAAGAWPATLECSLCSHEFEPDSRGRPVPLTPTQPSDCASIDSPTEQAATAAIVARFFAERAALQPDLLALSLS